MDDVVEPIRRYFAALNAGDLDALVAAFAEEVVVMPPDTATVEGRPAVQALYAERLRTWAYERELHVDDTVERADVAVVRCHTTGWLTTRADGGRFEASSREVFVVEPRDGQWAVRWYVFNRPGPGRVPSSGVSRPPA